jgi:hypothetical protein
MSPSIEKSKMLRPPRNDSPSVRGLGGAVLAAQLRKLLELSARCRLGASAGGGEGGSIGAIDTRPAIKETLCCEDRLRGRGAVGERGRGERGTEDPWVDVEEGSCGDIEGDGAGD